MRPQIVTTSAPKGGKSSQTVTSSLPVEFPTGEFTSLKELRVKYLESSDMDDDDDIDDE